MEAEPRAGSSAFASSPAASEGGRLPARSACLPGVGEKRAERRSAQPVVPGPLPTIPMAASVQYSDAGPQSEAGMAGGCHRVRSAAVLFIVGCLLYTSDAADEEDSVDL